MERAAVEQLDLAAPTLLGRRAVDLDGQARFVGQRGQRPGPARNGRRLNLLYGTQVETRPPRFRLFVNDPALVTRDWAYWVENRLRDRFGLAGVPVVIDFVRRG